MRKIRYFIEEETWEEQHAAGRRYPGLVLITGRDKSRTPLEAGRTDYIAVRKFDGDVYVLTRNFQLEYVGIERLAMCNVNGLTSVNSMFLQSTEQVDELLGKDGIDRSVPYIIRTLAQYV